ncbi:hypothetical protein HDV06_001131 [Boothiomyces sp. JEL0866]|nr:hypothetical protein HDV06_001131 [Boothiomyces sp. JEL0866]
MVAIVHLLLLFVNALVWDPSKLWNKGTPITIGFFDNTCDYTGNPGYRNMVNDIVNDIIKLTNLNIKTIGDGGEADITLHCDNGDDRRGPDANSDEISGFSNVGTDCLKSKPSTVINAIHGFWLNLNEAMDFGDLKSIAYHEILHALGFLHEEFCIQNPSPFPCDLTTSFALTGINKQLPQGKCDEIRNKYTNVYKSEYCDINGIMSYSSDRIFRFETLDINDKIALGLAYGYNNTYVKAYTGNGPNKQNGRTINGDKKGLY